jgi:RimJ/RimL family protein N-acetyltransferase
MRYRRFGITISLIRESDIELVRQWRNDPVVVKNYAYREYITPEQQAKWFKTINNTRNLYTIIEYKSEKVGVINIKNIDWGMQTFEGGVFIPYEKYHNTPLLAVISYLTTEIFFDVFNWPVGKAHVLRENKSTQAFIKMLGYRMSPGQEEEENQEFFITREFFFEKAPKLKKAISVFFDTREPAELLFEKEFQSDPLEHEWESIVLKSLRIVRQEVTDEGKKYFFD